MNGVTYGVTVDGLTARHLVRGGLDPDLADTVDFDAYVQALLTGAHEDTAGCSPSDRSRVAAAAIVGRVAGIRQAAR